MDCMCLETNIQSQFILQMFQENFKQNVYVYS